MHRTKYEVSLFVSHCCLVIIILFSYKIMKALYIFLSLSILIPSSYACTPGTYNIGSVVGVGFTRANTYFATVNKTVTSNGDILAYDTDHLTCSRDSCVCVTNKNRFIHFGDTSLDAPIVTLETKPEASVVEIQTTQNDAYTAVVKYESLDPDTHQALSPPMLFSWGVSTKKNELSKLVPLLVPNQQTVMASERGFSALTTIGVVTWGHVCDADVVHVVPSSRAFENVNNKLRTALAWADARCRNRNDIALQILYRGVQTHATITGTDPLVPDIAVLSDDGGVISTIDIPYHVGNSRFDLLSSTLDGFALMARSRNDRITMFSRNSLTNMTLSTGLKDLKSNRLAFVGISEENSILTWTLTDQVATTLPGTYTDIRMTKTSFIGIDASNGTVHIFDEEFNRNSWIISEYETNYTSEYSDRVSFVFTDGQGITWGKTSIEGQYLHSKSCENCPSGRMSPSGDATACIDCDRGYWSLTGSVSCRPCVFGICKTYDLMAWMAGVTLICSCIFICIFDDDQSF